MQLAKSRQVIAFGDVTHGTHELFDVRLRLIPQLVESAGYRLLAIEGSYPQFAALDEFLRTGNGNPAELLRNDPYWFWNTQELLDLIVWARAQNAAGMTPPIRIMGVDSTESIPAMDHVVALLTPRDRALAAYAASQYACLCLAGATDVSARVAERFTDDELRHATRVVEQSLVVSGDFFGSRDRFLAENVLWLAARGKVIVFGHNEHWSRIDYELASLMWNSAGSDIADALGSSYFVIGSVLHSGRFTGVSTARRVEEGSFGPPVPDDWALVLDQGGLTTAIFSLQQPLPAWMETPRPLRWAGTGLEVQVVKPVALARKFDAVLYVRTSTPTLLRRWPVF